MKTREAFDASMADDVECTELIASVVALFALLFLCKIVDALPTALPSVL